MIERLGHIADYLIGEERMYEHIDKKVVDAVKKGINQFYRLDVYLDLGDFRLLDRRLQSLRRRGILAYNRKDGWKINK